MSRFTKGLISIVVSLIVLIAVATGATIGLHKAGISLIGTTTTSSDTRLVESIQTKQDVTLVSLSVQGLKKVENGASFLTKRIPGTTQTTYLPYRYTANLGIDGGQVTISQTGSKSYTVSIPEFKVLGNSNPEFDSSIEDGDLLSFLSENVDKEKLITEILSDASLSTHISDNQEQLKQQAELFYSNIVRGIDPEIELTFEYAELPTPAATSEGEASDDASPSPTASTTATVGSKKGN